MQKVIVKLICDLPHLKEVAATKTIRFTVNGSEFEVDACADDARKMRATMAPFIDAARPKISTRRKVSARRKVNARPQSRTRAQRKHAQAVREWALAHNLQIAARGRIPARVEAAYADGQSAGVGTTQATAV
jgi:nucleoid-associated protein Lsr2